VGRWTIYVEGEAEVRRSLKAVGESVRELTQVHRVVAKEAKADLRAAAPVLSGRLRGSAKHKATQRVAAVTLRKPYVRKQEYRPHGPKSMNPAGWYFGPAAKAKHRKWMETYWRELTKLMDRAFSGG